MPRVPIRVRISDSSLWDDSGCFCRVFWSAVVSVCRGRLGLALTIMSAATLLSMASLLFACYAVVSENTRQRASSLKGTGRDLSTSGIENRNLLQAPESLEYTEGDGQVRAMIRDDKTGSSIYIRTPAGRRDQLTDTNNRKPITANIYLLLNKNVSTLLNTTNDTKTDQSLNLEKSFHTQSGQGKKVTSNQNITTNKYAVLGAGSAAIRRLPQAIIIGVKKSGTRALLEFIRLHPDVRASGPETHFFDKNYHKGLDWYRRKMPATLDGQITIEKTPSYFITKDVPRRVHAMSKDVKLIVVVRDPVTRSISDYTQAHAKRPETKPFEQMAFLDNTTGIVDTSWGAIRIGVYAKHLQRWLKYFPLKQIHFVNGEKLITDPAREMAKVQEFLGLKCIVTEKHFYFNESKGFPCLKKHEGSGKPHCLGKSKGRTHPRIDNRAIQKLRTFYHPFNVKFYQMVGQDFGWPVK